jgi:ribosome-associated protein
MIKKQTPKRKITKKTVKKVDDTERLLNCVVEGMQEKKAKEIVCIDLRNLKNSVADFFVVCHADSKTHVDAITRSIQEYVSKKQGEDPVHCEGMTNSEWVLIDYLNVVAHVFRQEQREFYGIERLWADAEIQSIAGNY